MVGCNPDRGLWCKCDANTNRTVKPEKAMQVNHTESGQGHKITQFCLRIMRHVVCDQHQGEHFKAVCLAHL